MLNAAVAAFAHRAISERNPDLLAAEALSYLAAGLEAERAELLVLDAGGERLEVVQRFPVPRGAAPESIPARGASVAAEALARGGVVLRGTEIATALECQGRICVLAAYARERPFPDSARSGIDAIAAMYAAAVARGATEAQLAGSEERLRLILDQIPAIVCTLDTDLVIISAQGRGLAELPRDVVLVGRTLAEVVGGAELLIQTARDVLAGMPARFEYTWEGRVYENRMQPLRDAEGKIAGVVNLGLDVTDKRRSEAELRASREELRRLSAAMNEIQENQRRRIAREIHDDLGQRLTGLQMDLHLLQSETNAAAVEARIAAMRDLIGETLETARRLALELRPSVLDDFGFSAAVEHEVENFARRSGIEVSLSIVPPDIAVEGTRAIALYRVIQEALTNVARHSGATHVDIRVERRAQSIEAEVRDNGRGITDEELGRADALGLIGIRERIFAFDGMVVVERVSGGGTRVFVSIPDEILIADDHSGM